ncbi:MAG: type I secretion system permease/ATPase [Rhodocyclaceae bacterium]|nr:type I secretion system permease/ATPase [Rhodocyclaceae bacterium]
MLRSPLLYDGLMPSLSPRSSHSPGGRLHRSPLLGVVLSTPSAWGAVIFFSLIINVLMLAPTLYMLQISDRVMTSRNITTLVMLSILALLMFAGMGALEWARSRILVRIGVRLDHHLGARLLQLSHRLNVEKNGGAGRRLLADLGMVRTFITGYGVVAALDAPWVPIYFLAGLMLHPGLALTMLVGGLILIVLAYITERATRVPLARANERSSEAARYATLNMRNVEVIEAMGMLPAMTSRWQSRQDEHLYEQALASDRAGMISAMSRFVRYGNMSMASGLGAYLSVQGEVSAGVILAASLLASRMLTPIEMVIGTWSQWGSAQDAWKRIDEALMMPDRPYSAVALPAPKGELSLEGIYGGPPHMQAAFVQNVNLRIPAGASVAVVGPSASGKSTLLRLITGVWLPRTGVVRIDGADIKQWRREDLGPYIGYLPQDVELIEGTIAENIARHGEIVSEKVVAAAQAAGVHEMILHLPEGYSTQVGVSGAYLSGGQRQRVALARALYGDPPLLILDEPNANLDEAGEIALDVALQSLRKKGQTVLIVSHRPTAIRNCDLMMMMQAGQVTLYGPRDQVLAVLAKAAQAVGQPGAAAAAAPAGAAPATARAPAPAAPAKPPPPATESPNVPG